MAALAGGVGASRLSVFAGTKENVILAKKV